MTGFSTGSIISTHSGGDDSITTWTIQQQNRPESDSRRFSNGGVIGIRTLARFLDAYSLSRGAPSATWVLPQVGSADMKERKWRREWDSNPRHIAVSLVFKTSSLNRSDISPGDLPETGAIISEEIWNVNPFLSLEATVLKGRCRLWL